MCISNYFIDNIPYFVNLFCTQFNFYVLFNLKYNPDIHQIYKLDVFAQPSMPVFNFCKLLGMSMTSSIVDKYKHVLTIVWVVMMALSLV